MKKIVMVVMDGVGITKESYGNAFMNAKTPNIDKLINNNLVCELYAHGTHVGLPSDDDMGNSEVGHNAIGCGQIYSQGASLVNDAINNKELFNGDTWKKIINNSKTSTLHFIGLLSDGNVHSNINHLLVMLDQCKKENIKRVRIHTLLDGRDVDEKSALKYIDILENKLNEINNEYFDYKIASGGGRMKITMDRYEANWDMVKDGWYTHVLGIGSKYKSAKEAIEDIRNKTNDVDQYLDSFVIVDESDKPIGTINDNDSVIFFNFRGDRALEISMAFEQTSFDKFDRVRFPIVTYAGMLQYDSDKKIPTLYLTEPPKITDTLTEELIKYNINEYAISETQKFGHVTYFWNGNKLNKFNEKLETYELVDSDIIPFDEKPNMKSYEITDKLIDAIKSNKYDFLRVNYPNGDMVGHTGNYEATIKSMEAVDENIGRLIDVVNENDYILIVTADHGNCEEMYSKDKNGNTIPKTSHTTNKVPFIIYNESNFKLNDGEFGLSNIASTICTLFDIKPNDKWNKSIITK